MFLSYFFLSLDDQTAHAAKLEVGSETFGGMLELIFCFQP